MFRNPNRATGRFDQLCLGFAACAVWLTCSGCSSDDTTSATTPATTSASSPASSSGQPEPISGTEPNTAASVDATDDNDAFEFAPLDLSALSGQQAASGGAGGAGANDEQRVQSIIGRLKPLQVMLGSWRGTTRREYEGFKAVDSHEWIWDLQTDPRQPALRMDSDRSPYLRSARLTWDPDTDTFVLEATEPDGVVRTLAGGFTDPVHEEVGSDDKLHRVFRMQLTQASDSDPGTSGEFWQIAFAQQENNRYLLELDRRRGTAEFRRYDTVSTQREGTSFAVSDSGYGEKTCIISEGLGTIELTYKGRSYWVCCTGCKAAFEDDPEKWIALAAKRNEEQRESADADP